MNRKRYIYFQLTTLWMSVSSWRVTRAMSTGSVRMTTPGSASPAAATLGSADTAASKVRGQRLHLGS